MFCSIRVGSCSEPTQCGSCFSMLENVPDACWVCVSCLTAVDPARAFYHAGDCDRCGEFRVCLILISEHDPDPRETGEH